MFRSVKQGFFIKSTQLLLVLSSFCLFLSLIRFVCSGSIFLLFLIWNLVLAFFPWFISVVLYVCKPKKPAIMLCMLGLWFLFFPNAPYILTDLIHIRKSSPQYLWFDFILVLTYSFTGLFYAYTSLNFIEQLLCGVYKIRHPSVLSYIVLYFSAYGIYLGRFLRWNSWDIVINMKDVVKDVISHLFDPFSHMNAWFFSFLMGTLLILFYSAFHVFTRENTVATLCSDDKAVYE